MSRPEKFPQFDYYVVSRVLGEGGMGIVYLARDRRTDLPVAIKAMSKRLHDPESQFRFVRENQILSSLNHRNIVRCYEITQSREGIPSIVMEYVDGVDLRAFEGRPYPELLPLMIQTLMGMDYLKRQSIVHRDLSSNNILVVLESEKRLVKILDFGIAKVLHQAPADGDVHTQTGQFLGKFSFASPELFVSTNVDWRSDVYSLGVIFFRLLTKQPPIKVERTGNYFEWVMAHQKPHTLDFTVDPGMPPLPAALEDIVRAMLEKDPDARPQGYDEIIRALHEVQLEAQGAGLEPDPGSISNLPSPFVARSGSHPSGRSGSSPIPPAPAPSPWSPAPRTPWPAAAPATPPPARGPSTPHPGRLDYAPRDHGSGEAEGDVATFQNERPWRSPAPTPRAEIPRTPPPAAPAAPAPAPADAAFEKTARYDEVREQLASRRAAGPRTPEPAAAAVPPELLPVPLYSPPAPPPPAPARPATAQMAGAAAPSSEQRPRRAVTTQRGAHGSSVVGSGPYAPTGGPRGPVGWAAAAPAPKKPKAVTVALIVILILLVLGALIAGLVYLLQMSTLTGSSERPRRADPVAASPLSPAPDLSNVTEERS